LETFNSKGIQNDPWGKKKGAFNYNYYNKKRMRNYKKKKIFYLLEPNCLQYLSKDGTLIIHYQNGISMSF
jgi:hypothetical protein